MTPLNWQETRAASHNLNRGVVHSVKEISSLPELSTKNSASGLHFQYGMLPAGRGSLDREQCIGLAYHVVDAPRPPW